MGVSHSPILTADLAELEEDDEEVSRNTSGKGALLEVS